MALTINIPDALSRQLESQANARHVSVDQLAAELLAAGLHQAEVQSAQEELAKLVEKIKAVSPNANILQPARASLRELLSSTVEPVADADETPPLSPEEWDREWANFEAGEKALDQDFTRIPGLKRENWI